MSYKITENKCPICGSFLEEDSYYEDHTLMEQYTKCENCNEYFSETIHGNTEISIGCNIFCFSYNDEKAKFEQKNKRMKEYIQTFKELLKKQKHFKFFTNKECEYYPCHNFEKINCLFCYCPLYDHDCNGNYTILKNGIKDCSNCKIPHKIDGYDYIVNFLKRKNKN